MSKLRCTLRDERRGSRDGAENENRVLAVIFSYANKHGQVETTIHDLACHAGLSGATVSRCLRALASRGDITRISDLSGTTVALCGDELRAFRLMRQAINDAKPIPAYQEIQQ